MAAVEADRTDFAGCKDPVEKLLGFRRERADLVEALRSRLAAAFAHRDAGAAARTFAAPTPRAMTRARPRRRGPRRRSRPARHAGRAAGRYGGAPPGAGRRLPVAGRGPPARGRDCGRRARRGPDGPARTDRGPRLAMSSTLRKLIDIGPGGVIAPGSAQDLRYHPNPPTSPTRGPAGSACGPTGRACSPIRALRARRSAQPRPRRSCRRSTSRSAAPTPTASR